MAINSVRDNEKNRWKINAKKPPKTKTKTGKDGKEQGERQKP